MQKDTLKNNTDAGHPMPNNSQDRNTTPPISREAP